MQAQPVNPFRIPNKKKLPKGVEEHDVRHLDEWVADLPKANVGHTAHQLYLKLKWLNRLDISASDRLEALDHLQSVLLYILDSLGSHYKQEHLPLSERSQLIADLARDLMLKMVVGYKTVVKQYDSGDGFPLIGLVHKKAKTKALQSALHFLGRILLQTYQLYQDSPKYLWQEIHSIYYVAEKNKVHHKSLDDDRLGFGREATMAGGYKQLLLLSLAGPYRMFQGEVERVYTALRHWVDQCQLIPLDGTPPPHARFIVYRRLDAPPGFLEKTSLKEDLPGWYLDTHDLADLLTKQTAVDLGVEKKAGDAKSLQVQSNHTEISVELKRRLMLAWGVGCRRGDARIQGLKPMLVALGMGNVFRAMGGIGVADLTAANIGVKIVSDLTDEEESKFREDALADEKLVVPIIEVDTSITPLEEDEVPSAQDLTAALASLEVCDVMDHSKHGCHLAWHGTSSLNPRVGELIGITHGVEAEPGDEWLVGVIRWLRDLGDERLEFGVEFLAEKAEPVMLWYVPQGSDLREEWCSLLVPMSGDKKALFVPVFYPAENDNIYLVQGGEGLQIKLTQVYEHTGYFSKCGYEEVAEKKPIRPLVNKPKKEGGKGGASDPFDELWGDL